MIAPTPTPEVKYVYVTVTVPVTPAPIETPVPVIPKYQVGDIVNAISNPYSGYIIVKVTSTDYYYRMVDTYDSIKKTNIPGKWHSVSDYPGIDLMPIQDFDNGFPNRDGFANPDSLTPDNLY